ncbi:MAG: hypothetical protein OXG57_11155 [Acidimicrobiaceae bacterium]|nr:hypothetical protein [Acidimicrobiaceae bacterium]
MAVTIDADELATAAGIDAAAATRLLAVVTARIDRYAPDAPDAIANEAAVRGAAYLGDAPAVPGSTVDLGPVKIGTPYTNQDWWRKSGAAALLSPWRVRRARKVEAAE